MTIYVVDPDYDTVLTLKNEPIPFAPWVEAEPHGAIDDEPELISEQPFDLEEGVQRCVLGEEPIQYAGHAKITSDPTPSAVDEEEVVHYHVSSRHLQLVSPWFKRSLAKEKWSESDLIEGRYQLLAHDWDEEAFLMLLNIIHLRHRRVPRTVSLELLAKVAVLVDYYECGEAVELFTQMWIDDIKKHAMPSTCCRDLILWIWVAWVFDLSEQFQVATAVAIKEGTEAMQTLGLPIPSLISDEVDLRRYQAIESLVEHLHNLLDTYRSSSYVCPEYGKVSFECGSFLLGALTKELDRWSLLHPRPQVPFRDLSFNGMTAKLRRAEEVSWYNRDNSYAGYRSHGCNLRTAMQDLVEWTTSGVVGLKLIEIGRTKKKPKGGKKGRKSQLMQEESGNTSSDSSTTASTGTHDVVPSEA